jgi:hypothetical protein
LGRAFSSRMFGLPAQAQAPKVDANGSVSIRLENMPNIRVRTSTDGMFKDVNVTRGGGMDI